LELINVETVLKSARLHLVPLQQSHAALLFPSLQDARIYTYTPQNPPVSLEALEKRYALLQGRLSPEGDEAWLNWAVRLTSSSSSVPTYVGCVQATVLPTRSAYLAYEFFPPFWGKGYAGEACGCVLQQILIDYAITTVEAEVDTRNTASIRLLERLGFARVGYKAEADFFKGSASDEYTYRLHF
jgi:[ribosomal protein S5]-alanine N-acetyltransferase